MDEMTEDDHRALRMINDAGTITIRHWGPGTGGSPKGLYRRSVRRLQNAFMVETAVMYDPPSETYRLSASGRAALARMGG